MMMILMVSAIFFDSWGSKCDVVHYGACLFFWLAGGASVMLCLMVSAIFFFWFAWGASAMLWCRLRAIVVWMAGGASAMLWCTLRAISFLAGWQSKCNVVVQGECMFFGGWLLASAMLWCTECAIFFFGWLRASAMLWCMHRAMFFILAGWARKCDFGEREYFVS